MMNKVGKIDFKKIQRISPSQFYSMKNCAYKSLLAEAMNKKPLLPVSANSYYGTVLHKMLELISKGVIRKENEFNEIFEEQIRLIERRLINDGYDFFVPLQKKVKDFTMKKILLKGHLRNIIDQAPKSDGAIFHSEQWYESKDKLIGGKIDLVIEGEREIEIIDFKTGAITHDLLDDEGESYSDVKTEYKDQLKLYAYLYFDNVGTFPTRLSIVDLAKQKFNVMFSQSECRDVFDESKELLKSTNDCVDKQVFTANPTESNCKYCLYRPACSFYLNRLNEVGSFNDVSGSVRNVVKFQNGNVNVYLEVGNKITTVSNIAPDKFDELSNSIHKKIFIFNLRNESRELYYSATKTSMIYE